VNRWQPDRQFGPATEEELDDARRPRDAAVGEVFCPECEGIVARVFDGPGGVDVEAWVPVDTVAPGVTAPARRLDGTPSLPGDPATFGFLLIYSFTATPEVPVDRAVVLTCWKGHGGLLVTVEICRDIMATRRAQRRPRRVRRPALRTAHP
jgi:hypothetical protein